jgi:hypothetical protein
MPSAQVPLHSISRTVMSRDTRAPAFVGAMKNRFCQIDRSSELVRGQRECYKQPRCIGKIT